MFYDKFALLCENYKVAPSVVVAAIGLNKSNATFWRNGSVPKMDTVQKLADYFGISVSYFFDSEDLADAESIAALAANKKSAEQYRLYALNEALIDQPLKVIDKAQFDSDSVFLKSVSSISDAYLKKCLMDEFKYLNRLGKFAAIDALAMLNEVARYHKPIDTSDNNPHKKINEEPDN